MIPAIGNKNLYTVQNNHFEYAVLNIDGTEVVPFGKYNWIDGFDNGLARVRIGNVTNGQNENGNKWGLVDENGKEILPLEYDNIWTFNRGKCHFYPVLVGVVLQFCSGSTQRK